MARRLALLLTLLLPGIAGAAELLSGDAPTVAAGTVIDDDLYVAGGSVRVAGMVRGDLIVAGGEVRIDGPVEGDVIAAGGSLRIAAPVGGSIRAAGGQIAVEAPVGQDLVASGGQIRVEPGARIGRDLIAGGGRLELAGPVGRDAVVATGEARIEADVAGDLRADTGSLQVGGVRIGGRLFHPADATAEIDPQAQIRGGVVRTEAAGRNGKGRGALGIAVFAIRLLVGFWALGALFVLAAPGWSASAVRAQRERPGAAALGGVAILLVAPVAALLVFGLGLWIGGWWIGLILIGLYGVGLALSVPLAALALAGAIERRLGERRLAWPLTLLIGLAILIALFLLPFVGALLALAAAAFGLGGLGLTMRRRAETPAGAAD